MNTDTFSKRRFLVSVSISPVTVTSVSLGRHSGTGHHLFNGSLVGRFSTNIRLLSRTVSTTNILRLRMYIGVSLVSCISGPPF